MSSQQARVPGADTGPGGTEGSDVASCHAALEVRRQPRPAMASCRLEGSHWVQLRPGESGPLSRQGTEVWGGFQSCHCHRHRVGGPQMLRTNKLAGTVLPRVTDSHRLTPHL